MVDLVLVGGHDLLHVLEDLVLQVDGQVLLQVVVRLVLHFVQVVDHEAQVLRVLVDLLDLLLHLAPVHLRLLNSRDLSRDIINMPPHVGNAEVVSLDLVQMTLCDGVDLRNLVVRLEHLLPQEHHIHVVLLLHLQLVLQDRPFEVLDLLEVRGQLVLDRLRV